MANTTRQTVAVGVFNDREQAQQAIQELKREGFTEGQIGVAAKRDDDLPEGHEQVAGSNAGAGAGIGAVAGLGVGGLWGLGIIAGALPAIGPAIAGGALASVLTSAVAGAAAGGITGALIGLGIPEGEAEYYEGEVKHGRVLVTVRADERYQEARSILQRYGAYDIHSRGEAMTGTRPTAAGRAAVADTAREGEGRMELREERLHAHPETTRDGEVKVRKEVTTEHQTLEVPVEREEVVITRHPTDSNASTHRPVGGDEEIRVPVKEEHARVEKDTVSRGEVSVEKRKVHDTERVSEDVKKEHLKVEKQGDATIRNR